MGPFAYKADTIAPMRTALMEQFLADLEHLPEAAVMQLARRAPGGWSHAKIFLKNARRIYGRKHEDIQANLLLVSPSMPWSRELLKLGKHGIQQKADEIAAAIGGPRAAILCVIHNARAESKEDVLPADLALRLAGIGKVQTERPDRKSLALLTAESA
ncbi:MAG: hypothetical protein RL646_1198, partial [Verrucomicrobiota bacterium]